MGINVSIRGHSKDSIELEAAVTIWSVWVSHASNQQERKGMDRIPGIQWWQGGVYLQPREFNGDVFLVFFLCPLIKVNGQLQE